MPPKGSSGDGGFIVTPEMMSILGCSADELGNVLKTLGFRVERRPKRMAVSAPPATSAEAAQPSETVAAGETLQSQRRSDGATPAHAAATTGAECQRDRRCPGTGNPDSRRSRRRSSRALSEAVARPAIRCCPRLPTPAEAAASHHGGARRLPPPRWQPAEPEMEEVWRPRRRRDHRRGEERRAPRSRRPSRDDRNVTATGPEPRQAADQPDRRSCRRRPRQPKPLRGQRRAGRMTAPARSTAAWRPPGSRRAASASTARAADRDSRQGADGRAGQRQGKAATARAAASGRRPRPAARQPGPHRGVQQAGRSRQSSKRQTIDPDSPFAKLSALKLELENARQDPPSS